MKIKSFVSFVIYLHRDHDLLDSFMTSLDNYVKENFEFYEYVLVNDANCENTRDQVSKISSKIKHVSLVNMAWKQGSEIGILAGKDLAIGDFIFELDTIKIDYDLNLIGELFQKCVSGFDIVSAVSERKEKLLSKIFYKIFSRLAKLDFELHTESVRIISRRAINSVLLSKEKIRYRKLLYHFSGFPNAQIKYKSKISQFTQSRSVSEDIGLAINLFTSYADIGLKVSILFSIIFFMISVFGGIYSLRSYFILKVTVPGWTAIMLFLSFGFSGMFLSIGILAKYLSTILVEVKDKPLYKVSSVNRYSKQ